ncbi:MAG: hypothetical protein JXB00_15105 [Bacteroidales bacterium]|nr:hypothetical protein [Bacteroidales bacterium]
MVTDSKNIFKFFIIISISALLILTIYAFIINKSFNCWKDSGVFGDSFGALNTFFSGLAFMGILMTILIQRQDIKNTSIQNSIERITGIIYNQINRLDKAIENFYIKSQKKYVGNSAFIYIDSKLENISTYLTTPDEVDYTDDILKRKVRKNMEFLLCWQNEILNFSVSAYNSVSIIIKIYKESKLPLEISIELKDILKSNFGFIHQRVIREINLTINLYLKLATFEESMFFENTDGLTKSKIFLDPIIKFLKE